MVRSYCHFNCLSSTSCCVSKSLKLFVDFNDQLKYCKNMEKIDTNDVTTLSTLTNDSKPTNEIELEIMMQKPSDTEEDKKDNDSANEKQLEMKMQKSTDPQKDTEDNEIVRANYTIELKNRFEALQNKDSNTTPHSVTQILTIKNKEVSLEEAKSPAFNDSEDDSSTPTGTCFEIIRQVYTLLIVFVLTKI